MRSEFAQYIPIPLNVLAGQDLTELEKKAKTADKEVKKDMEALDKPDKEDDDVDDTSTVDKKGKEKGTGEVKEGAVGNNQEMGGTESKGAVPGADDDGSDKSDDDQSNSEASENENPSEGGRSMPGWIQEPDGGLDGGLEKLDQITLGLRVYTQGDAAKIGGQLRHEMSISFDGLAIEEQKAEDEID